MSFKVCLALDTQKKIVSRVEYLHGYQCVLTAAMKIYDNYPHECELMILGLGCTHSKFPYLDMKSICRARSRCVVQAPGSELT